MRNGKMDLFVKNLLQDLVDFYLNGYTVLILGWLTNTAILLIPFFYSLSTMYLLIFKLFTDYYFLRQVYKNLNINLTKQCYFEAITQDLIKLPKVFSQRIR